MVTIGPKFKCCGPFGWKRSVSKMISFVSISASSLGAYTDPHCNGKQVIVHLFEWKWTDIALECERYLSKKGFCGVQVRSKNISLSLILAQEILVNICAPSLKNLSSGFHTWCLTQYCRFG